MEDKDLHKSFWLQEAWHIEREGNRAANTGKTLQDCPYLGDWREAMWYQGYQSSQVA
jgi:hypothetical protein